MLRKVGYEEGWDQALDVITKLGTGLELCNPMILVYEKNTRQGQGSLVGCWLWGLTESDTTEET